jgi:hypothetical protein
MAANRRKSMTTGSKDTDDGAVRLIMFLEYREENAKDMEREARADW